MIAILTLILGLLIGLYVSHHCIVEPGWETERILRRELGEVRADLYRAKHGRPIFRPNRWGSPVMVEIPHRAHSKVRFISHPGDLLK